MRITNLNQRGFDHAFVAIASFVVVALIGTGLLVTTHAAQTIQWTGNLKIGSGSSTLGSGYCLTTLSSSSSGSPSGAEGAYAVLEPCSKTYESAQVWSLVDTGMYNNTTAKVTEQEFNLKSAAGSNQCLNDWQQNLTSGTQMRLYTCSTAAANVWLWGVKVTKYGFSPHQISTLVGATKSSDKCLDDYQASHANGARVDLYTCKTSGSQTTQEWFEEPAPTN
jgi:hypothetical protein